MNIKQHYEQINALTQRKKSLVKSVNKQIKVAKIKRAVAVHSELYGRFSKEQMLDLCNQAGFNKSIATKLANILAP
jgi:hypothetical protein